MDILTPKHSRWDEFAERLEGPEGCNFTEDSAGKARWKCGGGRDQSLARAILHDMNTGDIDVKGTLTYCTEHGGYCDCEIIFNVAD